MGNYHLNKFAKAGIGIGLSLLMLVSTTACSGKYNIGLPNIPGNTNTNTSTNNNPNTNTNDYIDSPITNELKVYDENMYVTPISYSQYSHLSFLNHLNSGEFNFDMAEYYGLDQALELYNSTKISAQKDTSLLDSNGKLDVNKLIEKTKANNKELMDKDLLAYLYEI